MLMLFLMLFLYTRNNLSKIKTINIIPIIFSVFILFFSVEFIRSSNDQKNKFELIDQFKYTSLPAEVSLFVIEYNQSGFKNTSIPYFFTPLVDYFNRAFNIVDEDVFTKGRTIELLDKSNYLSNQLTFYLSKASYLAGFGTGSSIIAELYDIFNHRNFMIFSGLFFIMIFTIEKKSNKNIYFKVFWLVIFMSFIFSPRDSFLKFFQNFVPVLSLLFILKTIIKINVLRLKS
jgi:hypothetical protein